ncbi:poly(A) polymerase [Thermosulfidibacter takaii ABI70S6]|uniref:Poly(A) polymerase n=1 Tax=Thermosulfidibacter takaii (strain DSM 17441 / JCM 13301 / NBRC 103674 / ABI70S6) TaxID=1298851 RepID=A0A0S3QSE1_THET7|nr:CCA tRNA nucleotidyltransferase [Thermosulfidibacter takaii]BAT71246.1 poly(A) polymerase [Thermosulfidibacter takaii ABI70S6]
MEYTEIEPIRKLLKQCSKVYVVGGYIRDRLLGKESKDIDVVIDKHPKELIAEKCFPLDKERGIYRCLFKGYTIDICKCQGKNIVEDLLRRDFTVNAIAYDVKEKKIIDPTGGLEDLRRRKIKHISDKNLKEDPVRLLRAIRLWLTLPLTLDQETEMAIKNLKKLINHSAPERIKEELVKIVSHPLSSKALFKMGELELLDEIFPELQMCRGLFQGKFFGNDLRDHLLYCYRCSEILINHIYYFFSCPEVTETLEIETEDKVKAKYILKLAALLHDIAKPQTFVVRNHQYTFWGHDKLGAQISEERLKRLKFSNKSCSMVATLVGNHMRLHLLARSGEITDKAKGRFFRKLQKQGVLTVLLSLADSYASSGDLGFYYLFPFAKEMIDFYVRFLKSQNLQKPLLSGHEVMNILKIEPGPTVGKILEALLEAQTEGIIKSKEDAINFIKEVFANGQGRNSIH